MSNTSRGLGFLLSGACLLASVSCRDSATAASPSPPAAESVTPDDGIPGSPREELLRIADALDRSTNEILGRGRFPILRQQLEDAPDLQTKVNKLVELTLVLLQFGEDEEALERVNEALRLVEEATGNPDSVPDLYRLRGLVHLRRAETANCVQRANADSCIFPLQEGGIHTQRDPAESARQDYEKFLELQPNNLNGMWLLNLVNMTLGTYPEGVPERFRMPPAKLESKQDVGIFRNVASLVDLDALNLAGGVIVEDFDGDERLDIVISTFNPRGPLTFHRNNGDGTFTDLSQASHLDQQLGGLNCIGGDYDNDGRRDVLVLRGAWLLDAGAIRKSLLRNNGDGTFSDVTRQAGVAEPAAPTQAGAWGDFDNDGDLDLYVANESRKSLGTGETGDYPSQFYRNNGDGTFSEVAATAGVTNDRFAKGVAAGDYDNDGDLDLFVSNVGPNRLYRNRGDATFEDVAPLAGVTEPAGRSFTPWFFDYDNDGWLDLWVPGYDATNDDLVADLLGQPYEAVLPCLYHNNHDGTFTDVAAKLGLHHPWLPMGANFGDLDNDGWLDIYLGTGSPDYQALMPNVMLRNDAARDFVDVTASSGTGALQKGHGVAFADLDDDGDQDIFHQLGGFYLADGARNILFENPGHGNDSIQLRVVGTRTNRDGFGARVHVTVEGEDGKLRELHRAVGSVSSFGGSPFRQDIGLGRARRIRRLEVRWPLSGVTSAFENLPVNQRFTVTEGSDEIQAQALEAVRLGGARP